MTTWTGLVVTAAVVSVMGSGVPAYASAPAGPRQAPGGSIVSFVRDASGHPLPGAIVSAVGRRIVTSVTDDQGRCVFSALPAGDYLVRVHRTGYVSTSSLLVLAGPGANTTWSFVLKTQSPRAVDPRQARKASPDILAAGVIGNTAFEPADPAPAEDENSHDHSEVAWRLKHLKRSVLKEATDGVIFEEDDDPEEFDRAVADLFTRQTGPAQVAASLLSSFPLAGQVNLLTTGAFDSPQQLVSAGSLARGVAMVSLGASAGSSGDWAVQGAMTQGDVASWMVSGSYLTRAPARHVLDVGMSYSLQRYDGSNPAALAAVADGNRYAGMVYAIDSWSISDRVSLAYGARYAKYGYIDKSLLSPRARLTVAP
ncbi:MAG: carboxypeptidase regulatory-like domain-containing protein, partial [Vicinamibacteria bacterium]|nr:carboxypeptidase regulatory-like domain-containing protein [Vicinamibacteria bacterium]